MTKVDNNPRKKYFRVFVNQFVNRVASTGRRMYTIDITIEKDWGKIVLNTLWTDVPYKLPTPVIMRMKHLILDMLVYNESIEDMRDALDTFYYAGFPKEMEMYTDYERFILRRVRNERKYRPNYNIYNIFGRELLRTA